MSSQELSWLFINFGLDLENHYEIFGTTLTYDYNTYRIASQSETKLLQSQNPFALAVLAGIYVIKSKKKLILNFNISTN